MATGIIPANIAPQYGVLTDYLPETQVLTRVLGSDGVLTNAHIKCCRVATRPGSILSLDIITYAANGDALDIECFDLKVVTLKRLSDGAIQGAQMWVMSGTKDAALNFYPLQQVSWSNEVQAYVYFDVNGNGVPDESTANTFRVMIPGNIGIPHTFHEFYDKGYIINVWYKQGQNRQFWAVWHQLPRIVQNVWWQGEGSNSRMSTYYEEAWWSDTTGWFFGGGNMGVQPDGSIWPRKYDGTPECFYGNFETHAKFTTSMWWAHAWSPTPWDENAVQGE